MYTCFGMGKKNKMSRDTAFLQNGGMLVEALVSVCNLKCNPIRSFTVKELEGMTNNYDTLSVCHARDCRLYKGFFQDRPVFVKMFDGDFVVHQFVINGIAIASRMSVHKNVLKLIGCCIEAEPPLLVHEFAENGSLEDTLRGSNGTHSQPLSWKCRLRIAMDIANVIAYLHNAFSRPMIHRDIRPAVILLDAHNVAKLSGFSLCISIPEGESHVQEAVRGRMGYIATEYANTGFVTEKVDVFAFGMLLFVLLTGQHWFQGYERLDIESFIQSNFEDGDPSFESERLNEIMDPSILQEESWPGKEQQLHDFTELAFRCRMENWEDRPTMIEVAKELRQIESSGFP